MQCIAWLIITIVVMFLVFLGWLVWGLLRGKPDLTEEDMFEELWKEDKE